MIDKRITPQVMCVACGHIFPSQVTESKQSVEQTTVGSEEVTCPECKTRAMPKGVMQPTGFPSLETFKRNWNKSTSITIDTPGTTNTTNTTDTPNTPTSSTIPNSVSRVNNSVPESLLKSSESNKE